MKVVREGVLGSSLGYSDITRVVEEEEVVKSLGKEVVVRVEESSERRVRASCGERV